MINFNKMSSIDIDGLIKVNVDEGESVKILADKGDSDRVGVES